LIYAIFNLIQEAKRIGYEALEILGKNLPSRDPLIAECFDNLGLLFFFNKEY